MSLATARMHCLSMSNQVWNKRRWCLVFWFKVLKGMPIQYQCVPHQYQHVPLQLQQVPLQEFKDLLFQ